MKSKSIPIIAEIGGNHNGDPNLAAEMVSAAAECGCRYIKFQIILPGSLAPPGSDADTFFQQQAFTEAQWHDLARCCRKAGAEFLATPFSSAAVELCRRLEVTAVKIASCDLDHRPLIESALTLERPLFISTGLAADEEIRRTVSFIRERRPDTAITLLHCAVGYPAPMETLNLTRITALRKITPQVGFSDHSEGTAAAVAAMGLGACLIEKHFTLDRSLPGGDNAMSALPAEMAHLVRAAREIPSALRPAPDDAATRTAIRRHLAAARFIPRGHQLRLDDVAFWRPGEGLSPAEFYRLRGKAAVRDIAAGGPLLDSDFEETPS